MTEEEKRIQDLSRENQRLMDRLKKRRRTGISSALLYNIIFLKRITRSLKFWSRAGAIILGLVTILEVCLISRQTKMFKEQNDIVKRQTTLLDSQTVMMSIQNNLVKAQNKRLDDQTYLQEAERRGVVVFLMGNIFDEVSDELNKRENKNKELPAPLIGRIVAFSHSLLPYKFLRGDNLTEREYSPERGQLLIFLLNSGLYVNDLDTLLRKANFSHAYLPDHNFIGAQLNNINLTDAYLKGSDFEGARLAGAKFRNAKLEGASFRNAELTGANFDVTMLTGANFQGANLKYATFHFCDMQGVVFMDTLKPANDKLWAKLDSATVTLNGKMGTRNLDTLSLKSIGFNTVHKVDSTYDYEKHPAHYYYILKK